MVQFTILAAMVGMPMLVLASPLTKTLAGSPLAQRTVKTSGPLYDFGNTPTCLGIQTNDHTGWFTTTLCALLRLNPSYIENSIKPNKGTVDNAESASFKVYYLDPKDSTNKKDQSDPMVNEVSVDYKAAAGPIHDNAGASWFAGGFRQAILSTGGSGVANDHLLFDSEQSTDDNLVVNAGRWGFKYLTGLDAEKIDITEATMASKDWDALMDKSASNPITILTNKTPVNGIERNQYYTVCSKSGDNHITVWKSTILEPSINAFSEVTSEDLRKSTRSLYHLKDWAHL
ncbi:uncharacterized protein L203_103928 [Cryptococcus depauperatus CBS 7841]|uniref:Uncharacterized protein n=1 Tax=Cryptococcus depauperatus CBS 7841 TaxID=1295531 RepID=A0AAJ8JUH9_9TREE